MSANQVVRLQEDKTRLEARWHNIWGLRVGDGPELGRSVGCRGVSAVDSKLQRHLSSTALMLAPPLECRQDLL